MKNTPNAKNKSKTPTIQRFVFVEVPIEYVGPQVALWARPRGGPRIVSGNISRRPKAKSRSDALPHQDSKPSAADWVAEVTQFVP